MDWLDRMNSAMEYIETNLADTISFDEIAQRACCSTYHFQRMFPFITGVSLSEYIRRRRLTLAAFELQTTDSKVIDVAMKYGYDSPEAFARAFKNLHGIMPTSARDTGVSLKAYPRMSFHISIKGDVEMNYRIEQRGSFEMFGVYGFINADQKTAFSEVPQFRIKCDDDGSVDLMNDLLGRFGDTMLHAALYDHTKESFKYMVCYHLPKGLEIPERFTKLSVPTLTWAIFPEPQCDMQKLWQRIYSEWFPTSEYEQVEGPSFEMYYGMARHGNVSGEIWIPVKKK
ncbi:AraC family transcriptional regulator [Paenibacillus sp. VTT E-133280]|jgi:AraC family transcriptional regulator|uniref:AraC family transcriptional regulator n=1 Tax=Paenibacillus TaxID=44249 RepID=UPI000B9FD591|nr:MULTISPECIES: AraC family transcriptional regulator [unclassified Paenibacillus]KAA1188087.1 AraC family transcriptional regulator [Paenibacillus sp. B2(2019)]OZQ67710.1 AraC family transcriptional regulator [Paenibacillus sp. VTT E-133280]